MNTNNRLMPFAGILENPLINLNDDDIRRKNEELEQKNYELQRQIDERELAEKRAKAEKEFSETLINNSIDAILSFDNNLSITAWNSGMVLLTGLRKQDAQGRNLFEIFPYFTDKELVKQVFEGKKIVLENQEYTNKYGYYEAYILPLYNDNKKVTGALTVLHDITQQKETEAKLISKNIELERSNAELERFAYIASHDLKEPLRMVSNYTQLLALRYQSKLDENANEFINYAVEGVHRMHTLINDLLEYARIGQTEVYKKQTKLPNILEKVKQNLQHRINETGAKIEINNQLPELKCVDTMISQLFQNLIENALKFKHPQRVPNINIDCLQSGNICTISIADNGIGIDPMYAEKVFELFGRLHNRSLYPGNGIGLSICKKITERHGGKMWFQSLPGAGTTFYISLPCN